MVVLEDLGLIYLVNGCYRTNFRILNLALVCLFCFGYTNGLGISPDKFPKIFRLSLLPSGSVADFWDSYTLSWKILTRRLLKDDGVEEFSSLLSLLHHYSPNSASDSRNWSLDSSGLFTVESVCKKSCGNSMPKVLFKALWKTKCPKKACFFSWILIYGKINTSDVLQKKLPNFSLSPLICVFCMSNEESMVHLLYFCPYARQCWSFLLEEFNLAWVFDKQTTDNLIQLPKNFSPLAEWC